MKTIALLILSAALASQSFAGAPASYSGKSSKAVQPIASPMEDCFAPGFHFGIFGGGMFPQKHGDDVAGGGVLGEYFFTRNIGIQGSYGLYAADSEHHQYDASLVLRAPINGVCVAPYLLLGGGVGANGSTRGDYHAGAGVEARFGGMNGFGLFTDGTYHFAATNDADFIIARVGVKFRF
jgi:hypothetical protein